MLLKHKNKWIVLALLIIAGIVMQISGALDPEHLIANARDYDDNWWLIVLLIVLQVVLFTFALAGSSILWVAATIYTPVTSAIILAVGATLGGVSAYYFSQRVTDDWIVRIENSKAYKLLHKNQNFFSLLALRILPAFPHAIVNYSSGILKVNLKNFIAAAFIGVGLKSYVFSTVIYKATSSGSIYNLLDVSVLLPLIFLSVLIFVGLLINHFREKDR